MYIIIFHAIICCGNGIASLNLSVNLKTVLNAAACVFIVIYVS